MDLRDAKRFATGEIPDAIDPELRAYLGDLTADLQAALDILYTLGLDELHAEPERLYTGMVVLADGTDWDPGSGQGVYAHFGGAWHLLSYEPADYHPGGEVVSVGTTITGDHTDVAVMDGTYFQVEEVSGGFDVILSFSSVVHLDALVIGGRYQGNPAHTVNIQMWDYLAAAWVTFGTMPSSSSDTLYSFLLPTGAFMSGGAAVVRFYHPSPGTTSHDLYLDVVELKG